MARPTKLTKELLDDVTFYAKQCKVEDTLPTIEGLAVHLEIRKQTIHDWRQPFIGDNSQISKEENEELVKLHAKFSDLIDNLLNIQANQLVNRGLSGKYNATIAKVLLTKHGYREGTEIVGKDGEQFTAGVIILPSKNENKTENSVGATSKTDPSTPSV